MAKPKKGGSKSAPQQSPTKYITSKARSLPIYECHINDDWQEKGFATIIVSRLMPSGNIIAGSYLVDIFCLGLKQTMFFFNISVNEYRQNLALLMANQEFEPCEYVQAHNIIYGGIAYADELGFRPEKDFSVTQFILEEDDENVELMEDLEFGRNGRPCYVVGPYDNPQRVITKLNAVVGEGNYDIVYPGGDFDDDWDEEDEDDDEGFDPYEMVGEDGLIVSGQQLPEGLQLRQFNITFEPMRDAIYLGYAEKIGQDEMESFYELCQKKPRQAILRLEELLRQYPDFPVLYNYLSVALMNDKQKERAVALIEEMVEKFPDYLFGRINLAKMAIEDGNLDRAAEILQHKYDLQDVYPERDTFHISEVINYYGVMAQFFIARKQLDRADKYVTLLRKLDAKHPITQETSAKLIIARAAGWLGFGKK